MVVVVVVVVAVAVAVAVGKVGANGGMVDDGGSWWQRLTVLVVDITTNVVGD